MANIGKYCFLTNFFEYLYVRRLHKRFTSLQMFVLHIYLLIGVFKGKSAHNIKQPKPTQFLQT